MSSIIAPASPSSPYYIGKGLRGENNAVTTIFGQPLPNDGILGTNNLTKPFSIVDPTTYFDLSSLTKNHEAPVFLYASTSPIYSATSYELKWYRDRDVNNVFTASWNLSSPPSGQSYAGGVTFSAWIGWLADDVPVSTYPTYREIQENGNYHVILTASGGENFTSPRIDFVVTGIPAQTVGERVHLSGFDWTVRLTNYFDTSNYIRAGICTSPFSDGQSSEPSGILAYNNPPPSNSGCATDGTISGYSTSSTIYGFAQAANGLYYNVGSFYFDVKPQGTPSVSAQAKRNHTTTVSWSGVSYTTKCQVWANDGIGSGDVYKGETSGNSLDITLDKEHLNYTIKVVPWNGNNQGNSNTTTVMTLDETSPKVNTIYSSSPATADTIYAYTQVQDINPTLGNVSGVKIVHWYRNGTEIASNGADGSGNAYYSFTGLAVNTTYTISSAVEDNDGNFSSQLSYTDTTKYSRPPNWGWYSAKTSGSNFNVTAGEWNDFTSRINTFRQWHNSVKASGLGAYSFTNASSGTAFPAYMFNQARQAIADMSPPTSVPASRNTGDIFYASLLNDLMNSLNSLN